ncbi:MAG: flagellar export protein FliJ [Bacillota bacterium]
MRKFKFRLQKLLEVRRLGENLRRQELAKARQALDREKSTLARLEEACAEVMQELRAGSEGALDVDRIAICHRYLGLLTRHIEDQRAAVDRLAREEAAKRAAVIAARRERMMIEKLKERAYARYREEVARVEQAFLDEVGTIRYSREGGDELSGGTVFRAVGWH